MERRRFTRECKLEAVKLVTDRGVAIAQAARGSGYQWPGATTVGEGV
jgi:transposase-like protein